MKLLLFLWAAGSFNFAKYRHDSWLSIWNRWDAKHYQRIAAYAYNPEGIPREHHEFLSHIPPGYPAAIATLAACGVPLVAASFIVSNLSFLLACLALYELMYFEFQNRIPALKVVLLLNLFPSAYFFQAPYSEPLYLLFSVLVFYLLRVKKDFTAACIMAYLAIVTRWIGVTLIPPLIFEGVLMARAGSLSMRRWTALLFPILGVTVFFFINKYYYGDYFAFRAHEAKTRTMATLQPIPFRFLFLSLKNFLKAPMSRMSDMFFMMTSGWCAIFLLFDCTVAAISIRRLPAVYSVYAFSYLLFVSCLSWAVSTVRFLVLNFPPLMGLAVGKSRTVFLIIALTFSGFLIYFSRLFTQGAWAI